MNTAGMRPIVVVVGVLIGAASPCGLDAADPPGLVAAGGPAAGAADARLAVPPAAATRSSLGKIEEIFAKDYTAARTAAQKQALARTLFDESRGTKDAVDRWSLLRESMRLAAEAGDIDLAFAGVDAVVAGYRVDRRGLQLEAVSRLAERATPQQAETIARRAIGLAQEPAPNGDDDTESKALTIAAAMARKAQSKELIAQVQALQADARDRQKVAKEVDALLEKVAQAPDDADACLRAGTYLCFKADDWERGLPLLQKAGDAALMQLATMERRLDETSAPRVLALADGWAEWAAGQKSWTRAGAEQRAHALYASVVNNLEGLDRTRVQKRMASLADGAAGSRIGSKVGPRSMPGLVLWLDTVEEAGAGAKRPAIGTKVARWRDLSGNGNDAEQAVESKQPTRVVGGLQFDGNAFLTLRQPLPASALTVFAVYDATKATADSALASTRSKSVAGWGIDHQGGDLYVRVFAESKSTQAIAKPPAAEGRRVCLATVSESGAIQLRLDGSAPVSGAGQLFPAASPTPLHVGGKTGDSGGTNFNGVLVRFVVYRRALTQEEIDALLAWHRSQPR